MGVVNPDQWDAMMRKLIGQNNTNQKNAITQANRTKKTQSYSTQRLRDGKEGFTRSDFGQGYNGAAIPYQIATENKTVKPGSLYKPTLPNMAKPNPPSTVPKPDPKFGALARRVGHN
ncbi:hypothetical protein ACFY7C_36640 [Streptomyces sp. NPDC012769]|uniref:hypothetical protein n=1 Tax=Streptomyces sp. NPDC012769 TaxID=3364848 RepID=UPI003673795B